MQSIPTLPTDHICYDAQSKINALLKPLSKLGNIHYFCYGVDYVDRSGYTLSSHVNFYEKWFDSERVTNRVSLHSGWHLIDPLLSKKEFDNAHSCDIGNVLMFVDNQVDHVSYMEFGTRPDNKVAMDFYLNHMDLLKLFGHYFLEEASYFIGKAQNQLLSQSQSILTVQSNINIKIDLNRLFLNEINHPINLLSKREMTCLLMLIKGYNSIEISNFLFISPKTVHGYITRLKEKLECSTRHELIEFASKAGLIEYIAK